MSKFFWVCFISLFIQTAFADYTFLPDNRHQQFRTYGLFIDQQNTLVLVNGGRSWGALASNIALVEFPDAKFQPQLVLHGSANGALKVKTTGDTLLTETIDARVGFSLDLTFSDEFRGAIIWTHQSGHISDNVNDRDLIGPNLGNEVLCFRLIRDIDQRFRIGGGFRPNVGSEPGLKFFGAEQFAEWFPWGAGPDPKRLSPFVAIGFEEYGRVAVEFTYHAQIGVAAGNHFLKKKHPSLRAVTGYYHGVDPRMKYLQFKNAKADFIYAGLMFEI